MNPIFPASGWLTAMGGIVCLPFSATPPSPAVCPAAGIFSFASGFIQGAV